MLDAALDGWITKGYIEPSSAWITCNPLFVEKKNGSVRTCIDYRPINAAIEEWDWPLPKIRDVRHSINGSRWYFRLDLKDAFHRVVVAPEARPLTAFHTHRGVWQFTRMPFGLSTAPSTYQRFLDWVLLPVRGEVVNYIDDILGYSKTRAGVLRLLARVEKLLRTHGIEVNREKSVGATQEVVFCGLRIKAGAVGSALPITPFPTPRTVKEWQSALGFANCYRDFIPNFSEFTHGLYPGANQVDEIERNARWKELWTKLHQSITLAEFDYDSPSNLYLDASQYATGAVLVQKGKVCAIFSKGLTGAQSRYSGTDREHLALLLGVEAFRVFIQNNRHVYVNTDHSALLNRQEERMTPRQTRWKTRITAITDQIRHVAGRDNPADYWSRAGWKGGGDNYFL